LLPTLIYLTVFVAFPIAFSFYLSFTAADLVSPAQPGVGLANYARVFGDPDVRGSLLITLSYALGFVGTVLVGSLGLALLVDAKVRGVTIFRAMLYTPAVVSVVAVSVVWLWIFEPTYGLLNAALGVIGLPPSRWLSDPALALPGIILMMVWKHAGYFMVVYLAGLKGIPASFVEAAAIDGANWWAAFRFVTLPLLLPVTRFVAVVATIQSFQVFGPIYVMTGGGPVKATLVIAYYLYEQAFRYFRVGYASALAYVLFTIILGLTILQLRFSGREDGP
jgi:ABC-type sugar transport system permease subunit